MRAASARLVVERAQREARGKPHETARTTPRPRATLPPGRRVRENYSSRHAPGGSLPCCLTPRGRRFRFRPPPRRRSRSSRRAPSAAPGSSGAGAARCRSVRPTRTPRSSSGLSPEPAGRLRSPATEPVLRLGHCQVSSFPFTQVHQRGHKGDFFQREDRVTKSKVHDLPFSFMKRERCEELCESRVMVLPENTSVPAGVRSTLNLVQSHSQGPIWVAKTVTEIRNKTP
ncbi:serine/arginine repetitive matrix protein 1-like [Haliaeetus albicilla]|uniref:serine/arginine repetitive matrix protein 1-like n=1 Tax=Haliaeetus albicilla TaxID=8969 RepID=UPI0037E7F328